MTLRDQLDVLASTGINPETYCFPELFVNMYSEKILPTLTSLTRNFGTLGHLEIPMTMKTLMESNIATTGRFLPAKDPDTITLLASVYLSVQTWDPNPIELDEGSAKIIQALLTTENLTLLGDRIQYLPHFLETNNYKVLGLRAADIFKPYIDVIENCGGIPYRDPINFLANAFELKLIYNQYRRSPRAYLDELVIIPKEECRAFTSATGHWQNTVSTRLGNRDEIMILVSLMYVYFTQYQRWVNDSTTVNVNGKDIFVSHHSVLHSVVSNISRFHATGTTPYQPLPFGTHPSVFYKSLIEIIAKSTLEEIEDTHYPADEIYDLNIQDPNCRQLLTGIDLYNEGAQMKHCVGGEDYRERMDEGETLYFHFDHFGGAKRGATLSLDRVNSYHDDNDVDFLPDYHFLDQYNRRWVVSEFYGYDNEDLDSGVQQEELRLWLSQYFKCIDLRKVVYTTYYGKQYGTLDLRRKFLLLKSKWSCDRCNPQPRSMGKSVEGFYRRETLTMTPITELLGDDFFDVMSPDKYGNLIQSHNLHKVEK